MLPVRAEALKGHLDGLLLAVLEAGPAHGHQEPGGFRPAASLCRPQAEHIDIGQVSHRVRLKPPPTSRVLKDADSEFRRV